jgi:hypothetical protein
MTIAIEHAWTEYLEAERVGLRPAAMQALERFLVAMQQCPGDYKARWVEDTARRFADLDPTAVVRYQTYNVLIGPTLIEGVLARRPCNARLLSAFSEFLYSEAPANAALPEHLRSVNALLLEALSVDPKDFIARRTLFENQARYLAYTLHELPTGVLYGSDGASVEQCAELLAQLDEFIADARILNSELEHAQLIADCRFHYTQYRAYLVAKRFDGGYGAHLERLGAA